MTAPVSRAPVDGQVTTVGAGMKIEMLKLKEPFTLGQLIDVVTEKYPEQVAAASPSAIHGNVAYWVKVGRLEKLGDGREAKIRIIDRAWFAGSQ